MEFRDGRYISRIFYTELLRPGLPPGNLMGNIYYEADAPTVWHFEYRFRYYEDDNVGPASKDRKSWYHAKSVPGTLLAKLLESVRIIFEMAGAGSFEEVIVDSDRALVQMSRLAAQPWAHVTQMTREEWEAAKG